MKSWSAGPMVALAVSLIAGCAVTYPVGGPEEPGDGASGDQELAGGGGAPGGSGGRGGSAGGGSAGTGGAGGGSGGAGGGSGGTGGEPQACANAPDSCAAGLPCCAGSYCAFIDYGTIVCTPSAPDGGACYEDAACLSGSCSGGVCRATACAATGAVCAQFADEGCCDGFCTSNGSSYIEGVCAAPQPSGSYCEEPHWCQSFACVDWSCL